MPIFWRYALRRFFQTFSLLLSSFVLVLLIARFKEIVKALVLTESPLKTLAFLGYQIPLILPIAIPISALCAAFLFARGVSESRELLSLRSLGLSLLQILAPILYSAFFLALVNFFLLAEVAPLCRRESKMLLYESVSKNPLQLLEKKNMGPLKHLYLEIDRTSEEKAAEVLCILPPRKGGRLSLFRAKELKVEKASLTALCPQWIFSPQVGTFLIEGEKFMETSAPLLSELLKKKSPKLNLPSYPMKALFLSGPLPSYWPHLLERVSLGLSPFTLALFGLSFGIGALRRPLKAALPLLILGTFLLLLATLLAKKLFLILASHTLIMGLSFFQIGRVRRGTLC